MATARVPVGATTYDIQIDINGESESPGITILPTDKVEFTNNCSAKVDIEFTCENATVFDDIMDLTNNGGKSSPAPPQTPPSMQITTVYRIVNSSTGASHGPYSIEVAINPQNPAPLSITILGGYPDDPDLDPAAVPQGGWIQFHYDQSYSLSWNPSTAFTGPSNPKDPLNPIYHASSGNQEIDAAYTLTDGKDVTGGGSVKIRS